MSSGAIRKHNKVKNIVIYKVTFVKSRKYQLFTNFCFSALKYGTVQITFNQQKAFAMIIIERSSFV